MNIRKKLAISLHVIDPGLAELVTVIPWLSITWRKVYLSCCQTGNSFESDPRLHRESWNVFVKNGPLQTESLYYNYSKMVHLSTVIIGSPMIRSLISMLLRSAEEKGPKESMELIEQGFEKEFNASQTEWSDHQLLDYSEIFGGTNSNATYYWNGAARRIATSFVWRMERARRILYPSVNRIKNVSRETGSLYQLHDPSLQPYDVRTMDLEILWYNSGVKIQGGCEMRWAWKFNELKPRLYYATGGTQYWASRYMKPFAVAIMESNPFTAVDRRRDPALFISDYCPPDSYLSYWDLTSFTTTLSELKHYLWTIARFIEQDHGEAQVRLFDYREGIVHVPIWKMLDDYNEVANVLPEFSIKRIVQSLGLDLDPDSVYRQRNNGMLGVHGNIGFSTALHGHVLGTCAENPNSGAAVGDDALIVTPFHPEHSIIPAIATIGLLNETKMEIMPPMNPGEEQDGKFLKRRLTRDMYGFGLEYLFSIPLLPLIDGKIPENRTVRFDDYAQRVRTFVSQTGYLLWAIFEKSFLVDDHDMDIIRIYLRIGYQHLELPMKGSLPGHIISDPSDLSLKQTLRLSIPPVCERFDPRESDWGEWLYDNRRERYFTMIEIMDCVPPLSDLIVGDTFYSGATKLWKCMEDLKVIKMEYVERIVDCDLFDNRRVYLRRLRSLDKFVKMVKITVLSHPPSYYYRDFVHNYDVPYDEAAVWDTFLDSSA